MKSDRKLLVCVLVGVAVMFAAYLIWVLFGLGLGNETGIVLWVFRAAPFIAAFVGTLLNRKYVFVIALTICALAIALSVVLNTTVQLLGGSVDFPGLRGALLLGGISAAYGMALSIFGGGLAWVTVK